MTYQLSKKDFYAEPLSKTKAIPEEFVKEAYLVFACRHKFCRDICPNFDITRNEAHSSYGFHTSILAISRGVGEFDKLMDNFTYCLECGACELRCPNTSMAGDFYRRSTTTVDLVRKIRRDHMADGGDRPTGPRSRSTSTSTAASSPPRVSWSRSGPRASRSPGT